MRFRAYLDARNALSAGDPPIFVHQMGKVGSTTVLETLKSSSMEAQVIFAHTLIEDIALKRLRRYWSAGDTPGPYRLYLGAAVARRLRRDGVPRCHIISLVRDPVARLVSAIFQEPHMKYPEVVDATGRVKTDRAVEYLQTRLADKAAFDYTFNWFDREIKSVFGIDVFSQPFPTDRGWGTFQNGNANLLVIRLEDLNAVGDQAITAFLGLTDRIRLRRPQRVRTETDAAAVYKDVVGSLRLPRKRCEEIYSHAFCTHFYNEDMIDAFVTRWSLGPAGDSNTASVA